jgi:hypothetical protein
VPPATPLVRRIYLLGAAALLLGACGPGHGKVASIADKDGKPVSWTHPPQLDVSVLEAGAEPRALLRYRIDNGQSESLVMDLAIQLKLAMGEKDPPVPNPTVRLVMEVRSATSNQRFHMGGKIVSVEVVEEAGIPPALVSALRSDLDRLAGTRWQAVFTDRGHLDLLSLPAPKDANAQLTKTLEWIRDALRLLLPPLPETPVGKNARWQTRRRITIATAHIDETMIYKLASAGGPTQLQVTLGMDAPEQTLNPGTPPGTKVVLSSFEGGGKGQIDLQPTGIVQPSTLRWAASGKGTASPTGEPPAPFTLGLDASVLVKRR